MAKPFCLYATDTSLYVIRNCSFEIHIQDIAELVSRRGKWEEGGERRGKGEERGKCERGNNKQADIPQPYPNIRGTVPYFFPSLCVFHSFLARPSFIITIVIKKRYSGRAIVFSLVSVCLSP
jgi:hypothetical protein